MSFLIRFFVAALCALLILAASVQAQVAVRWPMPLQDFPGARQVFVSQQTVSDYVLALGNYKKVRGLWRVDEQRLSGELYRKTFQLPENHTALDGYRFVVDQLQKFSVRELYTCRPASAAIQTAGRLIILKFCSYTGWISTSITVLLS